MIGHYHSDEPKNNLFMRLNAQGPARLENSRGLQRICLLPWPTLPYHFMGPLQKQIIPYYSMAPYYSMGITNYSRPRPCRFNCVFGRGFILYHHTDTGYCNDQQVGESTDPHGDGP